MDTAPVIETVNSGLIPDRVKQNSIKIGIPSFPVRHLALNGTIRSLHRVW